ncbi:DUF802 domain-containing protein [Dechloromonas sp. ZY10]|uniref:DUF802 domain-containing protein n=1 Tax=Dechloromonas aquae TaxID=2664436 RepID=UPI0035291AAA
MNRNYALSAFVLGLLAALWVAAGYLGGSLLALAVTLVILAVYLAGALEMRRFQRQTEGLATALENIPDDLGHLGEWLQQVPAALRNTVRLRIEGERVALPGPHLAPYLVGLLVLLGMLGTFLGMVVTLNGAVLALESTTDLQTIRAALAAPVKGLGVAFGTSVAGVATSAMLGLISALCRRDRQKVGQLLDSRIAGVLRDFSLTHQRQETFKALQAQSQSLPELVGKLDTLLVQMSEQQRQLGERLLSGQERFHAEAKTLYTELAHSVDQSLKTSLRDSASVAAETIQPVVAATMGRIADENQRLHERLFGSVHGQLGEAAERFAQTAGELGQQWQAALARQEAGAASQQAANQASLDAYSENLERRAGTLLASLAEQQQQWQRDSAQAQAELLAASREQQQALAERLGERFAALSDGLERSVEQIVASFAGRSAALLDSVGSAHAALASTAAERQQQLAASLDRHLSALSSHLDTTVSQLANHWQTALAAQSEDHTHNREQLATTLLAFSSRFGQQAEALLAAVASSQRALKDELLARHGALIDSGQAQQLALGEQIAGQLAGIGEHFAATAAQVSNTWNSALERHVAASDRLCASLDQTQSALAASFAERCAALLGELQNQQATWQQDWAAGEASRQQQISAAIGQLAGQLAGQWESHGETARQQQLQLTQTLDATAQRLIAATQAQSETTIGEVTRLMQTAAEAPKAAAEVIGQLRQELSASIARDNSLLAERTRIMETLSSLLDAINHASTEQRTAIDGLVSAAAGLLERSGQQFAAQVGSEAGKLVEIGAGIAGGALEVASLGAAFDSAVNRFAESNDKMMSTLQRIEGALAKSLTRSDEQLAYYVAQAREIIDLSILSQKKMVDDLQRVASGTAALNAEA